MTQSTSTGDVQPIWTAIEKSQLAALRECWMIPQPAHAALAGEIASQLKSEEFPGLTPEVLRGISLHDAGWGPPDAVAIQQSRSYAVTMPQSFVGVPVATIFAAWTGSIDTAEKVAPLAGYLVSRHFYAIFEQYQGRMEPFSQRFRERETIRQQKLLKKIGAEPATLVRLVEALQLSDLLSLYLCCGLNQPVVLPQKIGAESIRLQPVQDHRFRLTPSPFGSACEFRFSAIRHPRVKAADANSSLFSTTFE